MKKVVWTVICAVLLVSAVPALAATIAEEYAASDALVKEGKHAEAMPHAQAIVEMAIKAGFEKLSAEELMQVADAHKLLMAIAYDRAIKSGDLKDEQKKEAMSWRRLVLPSESVKTVAFGEEIDLTKILAPGKTNIVDFYSEYCGPCVQFSPYLEALADARDDVFLIKVDINRPGKRGIDWSSPAAKQFNLNSIPHLKVYGPDGELQLEGDAARAKAIEMIKEM